MSVGGQKGRATGAGDLETLVLEHALDGSIFTAGRQLGLEDDTEGAVTDDLALGVLHLFCLSSQAILNLFANYLCTALAHADHAEIAINGIRAEVGRCGGCAGGSRG